MRRRRPRVGGVIQISLPDGRYAYGRVLRDPSMAFYRATTTEPGRPPIGSRDYQFVTGVDSTVDRSDDCPVVGYDPSRDPDDDWPPPRCIRDVVSGKGVQLYYKGAVSPATEAECEGLEPVAVWSYQHVVDRLMGNKNTIWIGTNLIDLPR